MTPYDKTVGMILCRPSHDELTGGRLRKAGGRGTEIAPDTPKS